MRIYRYKPEFVKEVIECNTETLTSSINVRYNLSIKLNNTLDSSYVFIMLNPSQANKDISDLTISKLCKFSHSLNEVGTIHIVNLYPYCETDPKQLSSKIQSLKQENSRLYKKSIESNHLILRSFAKKAKKIILAWGDCPDSFNKHNYTNQCNKVKSLLKEEVNQENIFVIKTHHNTLLTLQNSPRHPCMNRLNCLLPYQEPYELSQMTQ
ncbi:DUF1643 domain-containing protein [Bacillus mojavensis]|uniref:DUF1643 domain-containing protein n=1 Tax=Bacillus mojavensis TaxID=72360 RepID=UPI002DBE7C0E|nr:DUF1643 domain-containing protein [Bacillus mojavensis]MEC1289536.1 DUF1643 domain-containing protein [Bacillus mojavensis]MEC1704573.1 DUF1643 domain-containing protein [Bacillus mojavensis]MEC5246071.1 DUF1643 domain-containing protein [Bacillus mojavensis]